MDTTFIAVDEREAETVTFSTDLPQRGEFMACDTCRNRSYFFYIMGDAKLLSYCFHHGNKYEEKLSQVATLAADYSDDLEENRQQGAP